MHSQWVDQSTNTFDMSPPSQDAYPADFLSLFPFDDTMFPIQDSETSLSPSSTYPTATIDSPTSMSSGMLFRSLSSEEPSLDGDWLLNPTTGEVTASTRESTERNGSKRARTNVDDDIAACWKSPLCPQKAPDGGRPASCNGECAKYLFAHPSEIPEDKKVLADMLARSEPMITLEALRTDHKRSEMESTPESSGRTLSSKSSVEPSSAKTPSRAGSGPSPSASSKKSASPPPTAKPKGRVPHNQVEKKYRENVNSQLEALRRVVPLSRQQLSGFDGFDIEDLANSARQPSKATVLSSATAYIKQMEKENAQLLEELKELKAQNRTLQSLVKCEDCSLVKYVRRWKLQGSVM